MGIPRALAASVLVLSASCTLLVDTSGFESGASVADAGGESIVEAGDATTRAALCSDPSVVICEPFDEPASIARYAPITDSSGSITYDDKSFVSPPGSALFEIRPSGNGSPDATLLIEAAEHIASYAIDARLFIEYGEPGRVARIFNMVGGGSKSLLVDQGGTVKESGVPRSELGALPTGRWLSIHIEIRTSTSPPTGLITIGDATTGTLTLDGEWRKGAKPFFRFGVSEAESPTKGWRLRWDDIVLRRL